MMASFNHKRLYDDAVNDSSREPPVMEEPISEVRDADQFEAGIQTEAVIQDNKIISNETNDECYGIGSWRPRRLQCMATPTFFVTLLCIFTFCDAFFSGIQVALLTTLETRYGLSSYQIGMVITINKIGTMLGLPVAAYLGGRPDTHRPRWIAGSAFVMAIGMIATCIPQFIFGPYQYHHTQSKNTLGVLSENFDFCSDIANTNQNSSSDTECRRNTAMENEAAYVIILISQFVAGVGYSPTRPLGVSYIDDNVKRNRAGFYLGIIASMYGLAVFGFLASSATSLVWVDFYRTETTLTQTDQAWVSAWWLLFIFVAFILILSGIPFLGFPKRLPQKWRDDVIVRSNDDHRIAAATDEDVTSRSSGALFKSLKLTGVKDVFTCLLRIFRNGTYVLASLAFITSGLITGLLSFFPKYIESQFGLPTSLVNILVAIVIPALALGSILGGYLCRRWNLQIIGQTKLCLACVCLAGAFQLLMFGFGCQNQPIDGINVGYKGNSMAFPNVTSSCNEDCNCRGDVFQPVCWQAKHITYISPCLAGCSGESNHTLDAKEFVNCTCLRDDVMSSDRDIGDLSTVGHGVCAYQCAMLVPFLICTFAFVFFFSTEGAPLILTVVRSVESRDKTFAYGITKCLQYVIGVIPTPVITGALIDTTCKLWQFECGTRGACWIHDLPGFRYIMVGSGSIVMTLQGLLLVLCWLFLMRRRFNYENIVQVEVVSGEQLERGKVELELRDQ